MSNLKNIFLVSTATIKYRTKTRKNPEYIALAKDIHIICEIYKGIICKIYIMIN